MTKQKRANRNIEAIIGTISPRWKKRENINEIKVRAHKGVSKFVTQKKRDLNAIWTLFKAYPETFLFYETRSDIKEHYKSSHVSIHSVHDVQLTNMEEAIASMMHAAEAIYGNIEEIEAEQKEKEEKDVKRVEETMDDKKRTNFEKIFDDDEPFDKSNKNKTITRVVPSIQEQFKDDKTPIETLTPKSGSKIIKYLINVRNVSTIGDYMRMLSDKKQGAAFYQYGQSNNVEYQEFKANILNYVNKKLLGEQTEKFETQKIHKSKKSTEISAVEDIKKFEASRFEKDSKEMLEISELVAKYLNQITDEYIKVGLNPEEVDVEIEKQLAEFRRIVDLKREELSKGKAVSLIKAKIADGVKYKHKKPEERVHSHNPFVNDDFNI